jgi:uncharacterized coiled-coil DUF342 family protein
MLRKSSTDNKELSALQAAEAAETAKTEARGGSTKKIMMALANMTYQMVAQVDAISISITQLSNKVAITDDKLAKLDNLSKIINDSFETLKENTSVTQDKLTVLVNKPATQVFAQDQQNKTPSQDSKATIASIIESLDSLESGAATPSAIQNQAEEQINKLNKILKECAHQQANLTSSKNRTSNLADQYRTIDIAIKGYIGLLADQGIVVNLAPRQESSSTPGSHSGSH